MGINFRAIEAYTTKRREAEKSNATINRELELLRRALRLAHDRQLLPSIPKVRVLPESKTVLGVTTSIRAEVRPRLGVFRRHGRQCPASR